MKSTIIFIILFFFTSCSHITKNSSSLVFETPFNFNKRLIGTWKGKVIEEGKLIREWEMIRYPNGIFSLKNKFKGETIHEVGIWAANDILYQTRLTGWIKDNSFGLNKDPEYGSESYQILKIDDFIFRYENIMNGKIYEVTKMADLNQIIPDHMFSLAPLEVGTYKKTQELAENYIHQIENEQLKESLNSLCENQSINDENYIKFIKKIENTYGKIVAPKLFSMGYEAIFVKDQVHPAYSYIIRSSAFKSEIDMLVSISVFDPSRPCVARYFPILKKSN